MNHNDLGMTLREMWQYQVDVHPDALFLRFVLSNAEETRDYSYEEFDRSSTRAANLLLDLGVQRGERVAIHTLNSVEFVECLLALAKIGGVCVPLNAANTVAECKYMVDVCDVRLIISDPDLAAEPGMMGLVERTVLTDPALSDGYQQLRDAQPSTLKEVRTLHEEDLVEIMFTSGTTAYPKGVMLTNANFLFSGYYVNWQLAMRGDDRYFTSMAVTHVNFQLSAMMPVITSGSALVLADRYSATRFWRQVRESGATLVQSMAMMVRTTMAQPVDPRERDHRVRWIHYFLPLTEEEKSAYENRFGVSLLNNYGSSESLVGVITDLPFGPSKWPSIGRVGLGYEVRIVGKDGHDAAVNSCGEILVKGVPGVSLMLGYWHDENKTKEVLDSDSWYHTGDFGWVDEEGWYYFADRSGDLIKRAGENVSALCVEQVLRGCPGVEDVAVVGIPDPVRDERIVALVVPKKGSSLTEEGMKEYASSRLSYFKVPSTIEFRASLPHGQYGKVLKNELREEVTLRYGKE